MTEHDATKVRSAETAPESALLVAARQLSDEAWLRPQVAGLSSARQRAVAIRARRLARRVISPAA